MSGKGCQHLDVVHSHLDAHALLVQHGLHRFLFPNTQECFATYKILSKSNSMLVNSILFLFSVLESDPGSVNAGQGLGH